MNDENNLNFERAKELLNLICSNPQGRLFGLWNHKYNNPYEYITDPQTKAPYFVTTYSIDNEFKDSAEFRELIDNYLIFNNIHLDIDNEQNPRQALNDAIKVCQGLDNDFNITPLLNFSGKKGAAIHLVFNHINLLNPLQSLKDFTKFLEKKYNVTFDPAPVSSLRRLKRIPLTQHQDKNEDNKYNFAYFLDYKDPRTLNNIIDSGLIERDPLELLKKGDNYIFVPSLPDLNKNTEGLKFILETLEQIRQTTFKQDKTPVMEQYNINSVNLAEGIKKLQYYFKLCYKEGSRNPISWVLIHTFKRANYPKEDVYKFFSFEQDKTCFNHLKTWIDTAYSIDFADPNESRHLAGKPKLLKTLNSFAPEDKRQEILNYFNSFFDYKTETKTLDTIKINGVNLGLKKVTKKDKEYFNISIPRDAEIYIKLDTEEDKATTEQNN